MGQSTAPGTPDSAAPRRRTPAGAYATRPALVGTGTTPPAPTGAAPPRSPGSGRTRPQAAGGRPPASARTRTSRARPADTRPPTPSTARTAPRRVTGTTTPARAGVTAPAAPEAAPRLPVQGFRPAAVRPRPTDLFADLLVAVLSGHRPVHSMLRHTRGRAYDELAWLAERGPLRTRGARPVVRDIGYFEPRPGAIEAFGRIGAGDRLRAMAFRLELGQDLRWRCTAVELGGPRPPRPESD
ncbi:Rv3235 family protein [Streptomyces sp. NPDC096046]|uniref:Rv3235 family protein n=1 Tax=Streptomyces sp. NPDC096046 TaxID=3155542 RepID=UPI0033325F94